MIAIANKTIQITEQDLELEVVKLLTGRGFITGKSGSGKSNTAGVLCEKLLDNGYPLLVIDTEGEYYGLKEEYEILHVGADDECDLQVGPEHAAKIAELALEQNVPIILDVSGYLEDDETKEIIREVVHELFTKEKKLKKPFLVLAEEVHEYLPEGPSLDECGQMLVRVAKRGRKRGLGIVGLSQRPADVKKDFITQCDWRVWHRLDWKNDVKVVKRVLGKSYADDVQELDTGQGFLEADFLDFDEKAKEFQFQRKQTFDAGATPDLEDFERPELKSVSSDLVEDLEEISEQKRREQDRIEQLERELERKEDEIETLEEELDRAKDLSDMAQQFTQAMASGGSPEVQEKIEELRDEKNERIRELEKQNSDYEDRIQVLEERVQDLQQYEEYKDKVEEWEEKRDVVREALFRLRDELEIEVDGDTEKYKQRIRKQEDRIQELEKQLEASGSRDEGAEFVGSERYQNLVENMGNRSRTSSESLDKVMKELARGPATKMQLSNATGLAKSTLETKVLPPLKKQGWIEKNDDKYCLSDEL